MGCTPRAVLEVCVTGVLFPIRDGEIPDEFRFTIKSARALERAAGCNYTMLIARGQQIEAICLLVCYGLRHQKKDAALTVDQATDLVEAFVDRGGNIVELFEALLLAMHRSGCYTPKPLDDTTRPTTAIGATDEAIASSASLT